MGDGSAGLILGDTTAFSRVTWTISVGMPGIRESDARPGPTRLRPGALRLPEHPRPEETRAYFRLSADRDGEALARIAKADPGEAPPDDARRIGSG